MNRAGGLRYVFALLSILLLAGCSGELYNKYYNQGKRYLNNKQFAQAENSLLLAMRQSEKFDRGDPRRLEVRTELASCYMFMSNNAAAENQIRAALCEMPAEGQQNDSAKSTLAFALEGQGKVAEALKVRRELLAKLSKKWGKSHPVTLGEAECCAASYVLLHDYKEAIKIYQKILALDEKRLGKNNRELTPRLAAYADVLKRAGKKKEANDVLARAHAINYPSTPTRTASADREVNW